MASPASVPVTIQIGNTTAGVGHVEVPIISTPAGRDAAGREQVKLAVDHPELRRRIADLLRGVADELEKGPSDGD
jgi:hypothetical protein